MKIRAPIDGLRWSLLTHLLTQKFVYLWPTKVHNIHTHKPQVMCHLYNIYYFYYNIYVYLWPIKQPYKCVQYSYKFISETTSTFSSKLFPIISFIFHISSPHSRTIMIICPRCPGLPATVPVFKSLILLISPESLNIQGFFFAHSYHYKNRRKVERERLYNQDVTVFKWDQNGTACYEIRFEFSLRQSLKSGRMFNSIAISHFDVIFFFVITIISVFVIFKESPYLALSITILSDSCCRSF